MSLLGWLARALRAVVVGLVAFPLWTVGLAFLGILVTLILRRRWFLDHVTQLWAKGSLWMLSVEIEEFGREDNLDSSACLFLFNHCSFVDIFVIAARLRSVRFGAKIELFSIPFFGSAMRLAGVLPIARNRRDEVIQVYRNAAVRARAGEQFALSPEGGRNYTEELLPFKSGPFIFAIEAQIPLAPLVIRGASGVWPKSYWLPMTRTWRSRVSLRHLPRHSVAGLQLQDRRSLAESVRGQMLPFFSS